MHQSHLIKSPPSCLYFTIIIGEPSQRARSDLACASQNLKFAGQVTDDLSKFADLYNILRNYAIPQVMPHAIPQTYSSVYPNRLFDYKFSFFNSPYDMISQFL